MWSSRIVESSDPDEFVSLIRPDGCEILVTERGAFHGHSLLIDINRLYLQRRSERLSRLIEVEVSRPGVVFLTEPGPSMFCDGAEMGPAQLALVSSGHACLSRLSGPTCWGSLSLADDDMEAVCASYFGRGSTWISGSAVITPPPGTLEHLRALHTVAANVAEIPLGCSTHPASEPGIEQTLIQAMLACIDLPGVSSDTTAMQHHRIVIHRFRAVLEAHAHEPLHMPETSHAIGVSGRTLRLACQEQFGVSPSQYLLLRRMRLARRALRQADPHLTRVTDVATGLGFWELGRFSVKYRQIFGETPSATLRTADFSSHQPRPMEYAFA